MIDIADALQNSSLAKMAWSEGAALSLIGDLAADFGGELDWDAGAGERWARLISSGVAMAAISTRVPLLFSVQDIPAAIKLRYPSCQIVRVASFDDELLASDAGTLENVFDEPFRLRNLDPSAFSVNDLWFATI